MRKSTHRFKLYFMPEPVKTELIAALRERLTIIADESSRRDVPAHMARLQNVSAKIAELHAQLPRPLDPQLAHYLQRASYDKALAHIESESER